MGYRVTTTDADGSNPVTVPDAGQPATPYVAGATIDFGGVSVAIRALPKQTM